MLLYEHQIPPSGAVPGTLKQEVSENDPERSNNLEHTHGVFYIKNQPVALIWRLKVEHVKEKQYHSGKARAHFVIIAYHMMRGH